MRVSELIAKLVKLPKESRMGIVVERSDGQRSAVGQEILDVKTDAGGKPILYIGAWDGERHRK